MSYFVLTANRLQDGQTVYLDQQGQWVESLNAGHAISEQERSSVEADAASRENELAVVGPYLLQVDLIDGQPTPLSMRETIRASGIPTIIPPADADIRGQMAAA